jgi:hypothetical protein
VARSGSESCGRRRADWPDFKKSSFTYDSGNAPSNKSDGCDTGSSYIECRNVVALHSREINQLCDLGVCDGPNPEAATERAKLTYDAALVLRGLIQ